MHFSIRSRVLALGLAALGWLLWPTASYSAEIGCATVWGRSVPGVTAEKLEQIYQSRFPSGRRPILGKSCFSGFLRGTIVQGDDQKVVEFYRANHPVLANFLLTSPGGKAHRLRQAEELLRLGIRLTDETHVYAKADGEPLQPQSISHEWPRLVAKSGLPRIRFHDLRHSHATAMLAGGVHPKIASERLGHSNIGITLDLYSHVLPGMQEDAVAKVDAAMQAARNKRETNR
jgi:hypothetical protein